MRQRSGVAFVHTCALALGVGLVGAERANGHLMLGAEQLVQADGVDIVVPGYSVPSFVDWNNDGKKDLVIGEGMGGVTSRVRVYLNAGTASSPLFHNNSFYAQSNGADLTVPGTGCLGLYPRTVDWNGDGRKDLLVGQGDGQVKIFLNNGTDAAPTFNSGTFLQVGQAGQKTNINVGARATCNTVDWNNDSKKDLVVGAYDGKLRVYLNQGTDALPDFTGVVLVQSGAGDLTVPSGRSSPVILDLDGDGRKDLLAGNTEGQLLLYQNTGTDQSPIFSGYTAVTANGAAIDLLGSARSRPFVCDWTGDGMLDVLIGADDGRIHLYQGVPEPTTVALLTLGGLTLLRRRR